MDFLAILARVNDSLTVVQVIAIQASFIGYFQVCGMGVTGLTKGMGDSVFSMGAAATGFSTGMGVIGLTLGVGVAGL